MRKLLSTVCLSLALLVIPTHATETNTKKVTETMDLLQKEISCIMITDYSIRHLNLFIHQMETMNNSNGERKKAVAPLVVMVMLMRMDADKLIIELTSLGLDRAYIDKKIEEVINAIMSKYSQGYVDSNNYDKAGVFVQSLMADQKTCDDWFRQRFGKSAIEPPKSNGGVDG
jgi:hypothetical protein